MKLKSLKCCTICQNSRINEFLLLKRTLEHFHKCEWIISADSTAARRITDKNVHIILNDLLDASHIESAETKSEIDFLDIVVHKTQLVKKAIEEFGYVLYLDTDLIFLSGLDFSFFDFLSSNADLWLTNHYLENKSTEQTYGKYNGGMFAAKNKKFCDAWADLIIKRQDTKSYDQKALEIISEKFIFLVAHHGYNVGWWRTDFENILNARVINLHCHTDPAIRRSLEVEFFDLIFDRIADHNIKKIIRENLPK